MMIQEDFNLMCDCWLIPTLLLHTPLSGISLGFRFGQKILSCVQGSDILKLAKLQSGELDFLIGGPPCQGFSPNGKRWLKDNRNRLISRFIELARQMRPKCAIIENVPMALSVYGRIFSSEIQEAFDDYVVKTTVLNASQFGVPQIRKRAFIVALRKDLGITQFEFPQGNYDVVDIGNDMHKKANAHQRFVSVREAIGDLPALRAGQSVDGEPYLTVPESNYQEDRRKGAIAIFNHTARSHSKEFLKKIGPIRPGKGNADLADGERFSDNYYSQAYSSPPREWDRLYDNRQFSQSRFWPIHSLSGQAIDHCARSGSAPIFRRLVHIFTVMTRIKNDMWEMRCRLFYLNLLPGTLGQWLPQRNVKEN